MLTGWITFTIWLALFATAGGLFPRRPGLSGPAVVLLGAAGVWFAIGVRSLRLHHN